MTTVIEVPDQDRRARDMFLGKRLAAAGPIEESAFRLESYHEEAVLEFLAKQAGVPNYKVGIEREAKPDAGKRPGRIAIDELDAGVEAGMGGISRLIAPLGIREFYSDQYRCRRPLLFKGAEDRFADLVTWHDLNEIVSTRNLRIPQVRVVNDGKETASFLYQVNNLGLGTRQPNPDVSRIDGRKLSNLLRSGATVIVDAVQTCHGPVATLANEIESGLGTYVNVNLYASWKSSRGFATHWDDHDVFIVQAVGEKEWHLFGETRASPAPLDNEPNLDVPKEPVWVGKLTAGDVLYVPRGWWHDARVDKQSEGKGSIHLTLNTRPVTGTWVLRWLETALLDKELFRRNIPLEAGDRALEDYFARLGNAIRDQLTDDFGDRFVADIRAAWTSATRTTLSTYIEPWKSPDWDRFEISLKGRRQAAIQLAPSGRSFDLKANGAVCEFHVDCIDLIESLLECTATTVGELKEKHRGTFSGEFVDEFVKGLIKDDTVAATEAPP